LSQAGAAFLMLQEYLSAEKLARQIDLLFEQPEERQKMAEHIHEFAEKDAALLVAKEIIKLAKEYLSQDETDRE
jgi:UDP-N-acetylglucosamine:LPS N-acetylglucosamine transferase